MQFMVIERFKENDMVPIDRKLRDGSRMLRAGLKYIDSWVEPNFSRCFQLMECDDVRLFQQWVLERRGFGVSIEVDRKLQRLRQMEREGQHDMHRGKTDQGKLKRGPGEGSGALSRA